MGAFHSSSSSRKFVLPIFARCLDLVMIVFIALHVCVLMCKSYSSITSSLEGGCP
jgi:hypothetical protein